MSKRISSGVSTKRDRDFLSIALDLARLALGRTSPNPAVGCVIAKGRRILATGFHKGAGFPHAEAAAIGKLDAQDLKGATFYVNLEPCCPPKAGRMPPCTEAILRSGIREVVIGMKDPDPQVSGRGIRRLRGSGVRVRTGVLEAECLRLNEAYCVHRVQRRPFVTLKIATTLDGKIGLPGRPLSITGPIARGEGHRLRDEADAVLVGRGTVASDNPCLTTRLDGRRGRDPVRVVLDSNLRLPLDARLFHLDSASPTWVATVTRKGAKVAALRDLGVDVIFCRKDRTGRIQLRNLLAQLADRGIVTLLVEGGRRVWHSFLREGLVDRCLLFISPTLSRHRAAVSFSWPTPPNVLLSPVRLGGDLMIPFVQKSGS